METLYDVLKWGTTIGAGVLAYHIVARTRLNLLPPAEKRWAAFLIAGLIAVAFWAAQIAMLYAPEPIGWRAWIEGAVAVICAAIVASQAVHGARDLER